MTNASTTLSPHTEECSRSSSSIGSTGIASTRGWDGDPLQLQPRFVAIESHSVVTLEFDQSDARQFGH
jgi:hypothetical protein